MASVLKFNEFTLYKDGYVPSKLENFHMSSLLRNFCLRQLGRSWVIVLCVAVPVFLFTILKGTPGKIVTSDGNGYYAWLTTLAADGDLKFYNDLKLLYTPDSTDWIENAGETVVNQYPPGLAVVMAPGFLVAHMTAKTLVAIGSTSFTPYDPFYKIVTASWMLIFYILGLSSFQKLMESFTHDKIFSSLFSVVVVLSTSLIHYVAKEPAMSHGAVFSITSFATLLLLSSRMTDFNWLRWAYAGALVGLLLAVRNSTIVILPWWIFLGMRATEGNAFVRLKAAVCAGLVAMVVFAIQPVMLSMMVGHFSLNGYPTYGLSAGFEGIWKGLVSSRHGLFAYHPIWLAMLAGLFVAMRVQHLRAFAITALLVFAGSVAINGTWDCWWFGDAFGNRGYLDVLAPCFSVAGASLHDRWSRANLTTVWRLPVVIALAFVGSNFVLWLGYLLKRFPADGLHSYADAWLWWLQ